MKKYAKHIIGLLVILVIIIISVQWSQKEEIIREELYKTKRAVEVNLAEQIGYTGFCLEGFESYGTVEEYSLVAISPCGAALVIYPNHPNYSFPVEGAVKGYYLGKGESISLNNRTVITYEGFDSKGFQFVIRGE